MLKQTTDQFRLAKRLLTLLSIALLWLMSLKWPQPTRVALDESWTQVLAWAFTTEQQVGIDYIWTYGPWGYFTNPFSSFHPDLFYGFVLWWLILATMTCYLVWLYSRSYPFFLKILFFLTIAIFITPSLGDSDGLYFLVILIAYFILLMPPQALATPSSYIALFILLKLFLAALALTKFTYFLLILSCHFLLLLHLYQRYDFKAAALGLLTFLSALFTWWLLSGQSLNNFGHYIFYSWQLSSGYSWSMSGGGALLHKQLALTNVVLISLLLLLAAWPSRIQLNTWLKLAMILLMLFVSWKIGLTRHNVHIFIFFCVALVLPFLLFPLHLTHWPRYIFYALFAVNSGIALTGYLHAGHHFFQMTPLTILDHSYKTVLNNLTRLTQASQVYQATQQAHHELAMQHQLPQIKATVGQATVDIFPADQAVIFLNELNYCPRPVFQGYSAYTPALQQLNQRFFDSERAPEFMLFKLNVIDSRWPSLEDSTTFNYLLQHYHPVLSEQGYVLLQRKQQQTTIALKKVTENHIAYGTWYSLAKLNERPLMAELVIKPSLLGRIGAFFYRFPIVVLEIKNSADEQKLYRILPRASEQAFIFNPMIEQTADFIAWQQGQQTQLDQLVAFRLNVLTPADLAWVTPHYQIRLYRMQ